MERLLTLSVFALIGCVIWLLLPDNNPVPLPKSKVVEKTSQTGTSEIRQPSQPDRTSGSSNAAGAAYEQSSARSERRPTPVAEANPVELTPELFEKSRRGRDEAKRLRAQAQNKKDDGEPNPGADNPYFDVHWDGEIQYNDLEDKLLKLYSQRTPDGRLPPGITAEDVLSDEVLKILKKILN